MKKMMYGLMAIAMLICYNTAQADNNGADVIGKQE